MKDTLKYKTYQGSKEVDLEGDVLHGKLLFIKDLVTYEADTVAELKVEFQNAVDDYLETCKALNREPQQCFSGSFNVRIGPELHRQCAVLAFDSGVKLNEFVKCALEGAVEEKNQSISLVINNHNHKHVYEERSTTEFEMEDQGKWETNVTPLRLLS